MPCCVNGVLSYALLDTGAEATIISDDIYHCINTYTSKLEPPLRPVFGANNLPLDVVGETELTLELGSIKVQHKVLVSHGLPQHVVTRDGISTDLEKKRESLRSGQCQRTKARPVTTVDMCQTRLSLLHLYTVLLKRMSVLDGRRSVKKPL